MRVLLMEVRDAFYTCGTGRRFRRNAKLFFGGTETAVHRPG